MKDRILAWIFSRNDGEILRDYSGDRYYLNVGETVHIDPYNKLHEPFYCCCDILNALELAYGSVITLNSACVLPEYYTFNSKCYDGLFPVFIPAELTCIVKKDVSRVLNNFALWCARSAFDYLKANNALPFYYLFLEDIIEKREEYLNGNITWQKMDEYKSKTFFREYFKDSYLGKCVYHCLEDYPVYAALYASFNCIKAIANCEENKAIGDTIVGNNCDGVEVKKAAKLAELNTRKSHYLYLETEIYKLFDKKGDCIYVS